GLGAERMKRSLMPTRGTLVVVLLYLLPAGYYYSILISVGSSGLFDQLPHGLTFNSMLLHLLRGAFDVDPQAIGDEGIIHNGVTYAYFGILPALLRLFFLPMANFSTTDFSRLSCLAATCIMTLFKLLSVFTVWRSSSTRQSSLLLTLFIAAIL